MLGGHYGICHTRLCQGGFEKLSKRNPWNPFYKVVGAILYRRWEKKKPRISPRLFLNWPTLMGRFCRLPLSRLANRPDSESESGATRKQRRGPSGIAGFRVRTRLEPVPAWGSCLGWDQHGVVELHIHGQMPPGADPAWDGSGIGGAEVGSLSPARGRRASGIGAARVHEETRR
jgi:hypothetical protein